jgi:hypothetical protein
MAVIKRINFDFVEKALKEIVETSCQIRIRQEQLEATMSHMHNNEAYFKVYATSKKNFDANRDFLENERKRFESEISKGVKQLMKNIDALESKIDACRI